MKVIYEFKLYEVSIVAKPANPNCQIYAIGGVVLDEREE